MYVHSKFSGLLAFFLNNYIVLLFYHLLDIFCVPCIFAKGLTVSSINLGLPYFRISLLILLIPDVFVFFNCAVCFCVSLLLNVKNFVTFAFLYLLWCISVYRIQSFQMCFPHWYWYFGCIDVFYHWSTLLLSVLLQKPVQVASWVALL